ncbi:hypothetical protein ACFSKM_07490 [Ancylobacter dichloromethanicus]
MALGMAKALSASSRGAPPARVSNIAGSSLNGRSSRLAWGVDQQLGRVEPMAFPGAHGPAARSP